jgi:RNA-directed DNA polymerase
MNRHEFARHLSYGLTNVEWTKPAIELAVTQRLPSQLQTVAAPLAAFLIEALPATYAPSVAVIARTLRSTETFEKIFKYRLRHGGCNTPEMVPLQMTPIPAFVPLILPQLTSVEQLANCVGLPLAKMEYFADVRSRHEQHEEVAANHYCYHLVRKRSGGVRLIEAPKPMLKAAQRRILNRILNQVPVHADSFGFIEGRNCISAASRHAGEDVVVSFDLQSYFTSIQSSRVFGLFRCLGYPYSIAQLLTGLCTTTTPNRIIERLSDCDGTTYRKPHLPQGSPSSPMLANHATYNLDRRLSGLARCLNANYSRYADDLSFSGDRGIVASLLGAVPSIAQEEGFRINAAKTRIMSRSSRQTVTGMVVNEHVNVDRRYFDKIKATIWACRKLEDQRLQDGVFLAQLLGRINWVENVNPARGNKLRELLADAMADRAHA